MMGDRGISASAGPDASHLHSMVQQLSYFTQVTTSLTLAGPPGALPGVQIPNRKCQSTADNGNYNGRVLFVCVCLSLSDSPCSKRKAARANNTKIGIHILRRTPYVCIDIRVKRSVGEVSCAACVGLHVDTTAHIVYSNTVHCLSCNEFPSSAILGQTVQLL